MKSLQNVSTFFPGDAREFIKVAVLFGFIFLGLSHTAQAISDEGYWDHAYKKSIEQGVQLGNTEEETFKEDISTFQSRLQEAQTLKKNARTPQEYDAYLAQEGEAQSYIDGFTKARSRALAKNGIINKLRNRFFDFRSAEQHSRDAHDALQKGDRTEAIEDFKKACLQKDLDSCNTFLRNLPDDLGAEKHKVLTDIYAAMISGCKQAPEGDPMKCSSAGLAAELDGNKELAFEAGKKGCDLSDSDSCRYVGSTLFIKCTEGGFVESDFNEAQVYYKKGCELNNHLACLDLVRLLIISPNISIENGKKLLAKMEDNRKDGCDGNNRTWSPSECESFPVLFKSVTHALEQRISLSGK